MCCIICKPQLAYEISIFNLSLQGLNEALSGCFRSWFTVNPDLPEDSCSHQHTIEILHIYAYLIVEKKKWNSEIFWKAEVKKTIRLSKIRHNQYISYISCYSEKIPNRSNFRKKEYRNSEFEITVHHINSCLNMFAKLYLQSGNRERAMLGLSILPPLNKVRDARTEVAIFVSALVLLLTHCRKSLEVMQKTLLLQF